MLVLGGAIVLAGNSPAQELAPATIARGPSALTNDITLSWLSIPGRIYEVQTRDGLEAPWLATNLAPVRARSSRAAVKDGTAGTNVPVRLYQIRAQPVPPGNTSPITSTTVAELEKVLGLTFTPAQRSALAGSLSSRRSNIEAMRKFRLRNSDAPPLIFDPIAPGFTLETEQKPITWSTPISLTLPTNRTELALKQAAQADAEIAAGRHRGPLHGIPYGLKDLFSVRGYRTTWGAAPFADQVIDKDATVAKKLEDAGAVLLAKLSTGELANGDEWFGGRTLNPWNTGEGSSGSSAGPASATAAGLVAFSIGSETWGSIVSPSTRCRVTELRPTFGRVSRAGGMTLSWTMDKVGPICRNVEDCAIVLDAIRGPDGLDHAVLDVPFNYPAHPELMSLRVGYRRGQLSTSIVDRLAALVGAEHLVLVSLPVNPVDPLLILQVEAAAAFDELTRFGGDAFLLAQVGWPQLFRVGRTIPAVEYFQASRLRQKLIQDMAELMETIDVYVGNQAEVVDGATSGLTNLTGQPCVEIPHGGGTSLGFIGRPFDEATILALAKAYQDLTPFHTNRPPSFVR